MKKTLSLIMAFIMVALVGVAALPMTAFAATGTYTSDADAKAAGMYFRIGAADATNGAVYADTLQNAVKTFTTAQTEVTIYQIQDYSGANPWQAAPSVVITTLTVDGQGFDFNSTKAGEYHNCDKIANLIVRNYGDFCVGRSISTTYVMNMYFQNIGKFTSTDRPAIWHQATSGTVAIEFLNTTVNVTCSENGIKIGAEGTTTNAVFNVKLTNSVITRTGTTNSGGNAALVNFGGANTVNFTLEDDSKLIANHTNAGTAHIFHTGTKSENTKVNITLEQDSQIIQQGKAATIKVLAHPTTNTTTTITDQGCKYIIKADAANGTFEFPNISGKKFVSGTTSVSAGGTYSKTSNTEMIFTIADASAITNDESAVTEGMVARIGEETALDYYSNLNAAVTAAKTKTGTIYLIQDTTVTSNMTLDGEYTVTIDGQNYTLTATNSDNYIMSVLNGAKVTFQNITMNLRGGFWAKGTAEVTLKDSTITTSSRPLWKNSATVNSEDVVATGNILTMDNVKATMNATHTSAAAVHGQNMILSEYYAQGAMILKNGTVLTQATQSGSATGNNAAININENSVLSVTVGSGCEIVNAVYEGVDTPDYSTGHAIYCNAKKTGSTVTLEAGSKLTVAASTLETINFIRENNNVTINDKGCTYTVKADALKAADVLLPTAITVNGKDLLAYSSSAGLLADKVAKNAEATEDLTFTAVGYDASMFDMVDGASIRTSKPYGIRFTANINEALYDQLVAADANIEFGMVLGAQRYIFGEEFFTNLDSQNTDNYAKVTYTRDQLRDTTDEGGNAVKQFRAALYIKGNEEAVNLTATQCDTLMTANAYFTIHLADGTTKTIWAAWDETNNTRSLRAVASAYATAQGGIENVSKTIQDIINAQ